MKGKRLKRAKPDEEIEKLRSEIFDLKLELERFQNAECLLADYMADLRCAKRDADANGGDGYFDYLIRFETIEERERQAEALLTTELDPASALLTFWDGTKHERCKCERCGQDHWQRIRDHENGPEAVVAAILRGMGTQPPASVSAPQPEDTQPGLPLTGE